MGDRVGLLTRCLDLWDTHLSDEGETGKRQYTSSEVCLFVCPNKIGDPSFLSPQLLGSNLSTPILTGSDRNKIPKSVPIGLHNSTTV